eukprot:jgi/Astpho2/5365/Aster-05910
MANWLDSDLLQDAASPYQFTQGIRGRSVSRSPSKLTPDAFIKVASRHGVAMFPENMPPMQPDPFSPCRLCAQKSLLEPKPRASAPLPHIFGSAAYLQDHTAGLGSILDPSLAEQQPASAQEDQRGDGSPHSPARLQSKAQQTDTGTDLTFQGSGLSGEIAGSSPPQAGEGGLPNLAKLAKGPQDFKSMLEAALRDSMGGNLPDIYAVE